MRQAAIYVRISRDREGAGVGVDRQEHDCRRRAAELGWEVARVFSDNDVSASRYGRKRRPAYDEMLEGIASGRFTAVIAWHGDRLHRRPAELEQFIDVIDAADATVDLVAGGRWDFSSASGRFNARITGDVAAYESEHRSERTRAAHAELARRGRWKGGRRPYGYEPVTAADGSLDRSKRGRLQIVVAEAAIIREVVDRVLHGEPLYAVTCDLNARGVPTIHGGAWRTQTLRRIITSPTVYGHREHQGEDVGPASWPAVVDRATVERVRAALRGRGLPRPAPARVSLLAGIATCGACGAKLASARRTSGRRVYVCPSRTGPRPGCGGLSASAERADDLVGAAVIAAIAGDRLREVADTISDTPEVAERLAAAEGRIVELAGDFADGVITRAEWLEVRARLERTISHAQSELQRRTAASVLHGLPTSREALGAAWEDEWQLDRKRAIVATIVERVVIAPAKTRGRTFDDRRVLDGIIWRA